MATFNDDTGREWEMTIDRQSIATIRKQCDPLFLLDSEDTDNTYSRMMADPVLLCRVIYLLCTKQRKDRKVSEKTFYLDVLGPAIDQATEAMLDAILSFLPKQTRELMEAVATRERRSDDDVLPYDPEFLQGTD
jgi:hypothetical protein